MASKQSTTLRECFEDELYVTHVVKSALLWASAAPRFASKKGSKERRKDQPPRRRSTAEVARIRFFDSPRVESLQVEIHVLSSVIWSMMPWRARPIPPGILSIRDPFLWERLETFDCWPSEHDQMCIQNAFNKVAGAEVFWRACVSAENQRSAINWLAEGRGRKVRNLWQGKILALCAIRAANKWKRYFGCQGLAAENIGPQIFFGPEMPEEIIEITLSYADASSLRCFSAASSFCRKFVRRTPSLAGIWRRNLFFAKTDQERNWKWTNVCAEDFPCSLTAPRPTDCSFCSLGANSVRGGLCREESQLQHFSAKMLKKYVFKQEDVTDKLLSVGVSDDNNEFKLMSRNAFVPSKTPMLIFGRFRIGRKMEALIACVGSDKYGGFIGCGIASFRQSGYARLITNVVLCCRYLKPGDPRMKWSLQDILMKVRFEIGTSRERMPWVSPIFSLDYQPGPLGEISMPPRRLPDPTFDLNLRLVCDFREIVVATEVWRVWKGYRCDNEYCNGEHTSFDPHSLCQNHQIIGIRQFLSTTSGRLSFCGKDCFCRWLSTCPSFRPPFRCVSNVIWKDTCWGCGADGVVAHYNCCVSGDIKVAVQHPTVPSFLANEEAKFCSKECVRKALPELLRACQEYQRHELTSGNLYMAKGGFFDTIKGNAATYEMFVRDGWKPEWDEDGHSFWSLGRPSGDILEI